MPRLKGKRFHLTYARCDLSIQHLYDCLAGLSFEPIKRCRIAHELHADGFPHRHVCIELDKPIEIRNADALHYFDVEGHHPQILPKRLPKAWKNAWKYLEKHGEFIDFGESGSGYPDSEEDEESLVETAQNADDFVTYLRFVERNRRNPTLAKLIWDAVSQRSGADRTIQNPDDSGTLSGRIRDDRLRNLEYDGEGPHGPASVVICGPSSIGKTSWALLHAPKPALWVVHAEDLKLFRPSYHQCLIIDDQCFQHQPRSAQLQWVDRRNPVTIHIRYTRIHLPAGCHRIFTCNLGQQHLPVQLGIGDDAMDNRVVLHTF